MDAPQPARFLKPLRPIGFMGTRIMGLPDGASPGGGRLSVQGVTAPKVKLCAEAFAAQIVDSPREATTDVSVLVTMVTASEAIEKVMLGREGFLSFSTQGVPWIQMCQLLVRAARQANWRAYDVRSLPR